MTSSFGPRSGTKTIAAANTPERLVTPSVPCAAVGVKRITGSVRIGQLDVGATGWSLTQPIAFDVDDASNVWVYGTLGATIEWIVLKRIQ